MNPFWSKPVTKISWSWTLSAGHMHSHVQLHIQYIHTKFCIQTHNPTYKHRHTHIPAVGSAPNALTSSLSPPLAFSPPPVSISLKWSQESNTTTMNCAAGERGREKVWNGDREREGERTGEGTNTLLSPLFSATHKKITFWRDTKKRFYPPPLSSLSLLCFLLFSLTNPFPPFSLIIFPLSFLSKRDIFLLMT